MHSCDFDQGQEPTPFTSISHCFWWFFVTVAALNETWKFNFHIRKRWKSKALASSARAHQDLSGWRMWCFFSQVISGGMFAMCLGRWLGQLLNDTEATTVGYGTSFAGNGLIYIVIRYSAFECFWSMGQYSTKRNGIEEMNVSTGSVWLSDFWPHTAHGSIFWTWLTAREWSIEDDSCQPVDGFPAEGMSSQRLHWVGWQQLEPSMPEPEQK